ncbi:MAG: nuclear transport factor 2 family protein [Desulfobacterales bacterium]|jgi:hypothetical protein|nr:nuclear transport factor 2 family protein [Desulfobacteraceae bacterium]MBT7087243.1 nuclear transport factor 2 family protein [Desulfobacterales bacterium]MBT7697553.1 nuclear transport factor 2 family protein [Desulfobacterales bacterium]
MDISKIEYLFDRMEISDTVNRYATGVDMRDWALYRSCFTEEIEMNFKSWSGKDPQKFPVDEWVDTVRGTLSGFESTQHISSNHVTTIDGDNATCVSYMQAQHYLPNDLCDNTCTLGGYYTNELIKTSKGWKICRCKFTVLWRTGDPRIFELAQENAF